MKRNKGLGNNPPADVHNRVAKQQQEIERNLLAIRALDYMIARQETGEEKISRLESLHCQDCEGSVIGCGHCNIRYEIDKIVNG